MTALIILAVFLLFVWRWQVVTALFIMMLVITNVASYVGKRKRARLRHPVSQWALQCVSDVFGAIGVGYMSMVSTSGGGSPSGHPKVGTALVGRLVGLGAFG